MGMNIAFFSDTYNPQVNGVVTVLNILKRGLEERGHRVYVYTISHPDAEKEENVYRVPSVKFPKEPQHRMALFLSPRIFKLLKEQNIHVIHSHSPFALGHLAIAAAKTMRKPLIHTFHTFYEEYVHYLGPLKVIVTRNFIKFLGKRFCNFHDVIIAPSEKIKKVIEGYGTRTPIEIIPNGVDLTPFREPVDEDRLKDFRERFGIGKDDKVVIFVGRMAKEKSVEKLLENFKRVSEDVKNAKLLLVGDGPDREKYERLCSELGIDDRVIFTGYLKWPEEVAVAYRISDVFVSASHTEVHPITFIEAAASGLPLVVYDDPSNVIVARDGENAFVFKSKDELHIGITRILKSPSLKEIFSRRSVEISEEFSAERFVERMERLYEFYHKLHEAKRSMKSGV